MLTALPFGAAVEDTGQYMLGSVLVTPVFMESVGTVDTATQDVSTEDWTPQLVQETKDRIESGLQWWVDTLATQTDKHSLDFQLDYTYADDPVETLYEPISRKSNAFEDWTDAFLDAADANITGDVTQDIWDFNHAQRLKFDTNWAFTIFVVNSTNDVGDSFAPGGNFDQAFAFAGGRFFVLPSERPDSTVAHETAHMFWGLDEYTFSASWSDERGYYSTQNLNAVDGNPADPFVQADSIMSNEDSLQIAFADHASPESTLAMIGWRDSDGNGVFDVLDVPLSLTGFGQFDADTGLYHFEGQSSVETLPNQNSEGNRNDTTINKVSRAEYRVDGGPWQTAATDDEDRVDVQLSIGPLVSGPHVIEIRTVDAVTGVSSNVFVGTTERPSLATVAGINGGVWNDANGNGQWDNDERGVEGATVRLVDDGGDPLDLTRTLEPDDHTSDFQIINNALPGVLLSSIGSGVADTTVLSRVGAASSTGSRVFAHFRSGNQVATEWTPVSRRLKIEFGSPVSAVRLDAVGVNGSDVGRLDVFDASDNLLARYTTDPLNADQVETMVVELDSANIAYAIAGGHAASPVRLDFLRVGPSSQTATDSLGGYQFRSLPDDTYNVEVTPPSHWEATNPNPARQTVAYQSGETIGEVDFGGRVVASIWQNPENRFDVNGDGSESPIDVLQIINDLNANGARELSEPPGGASPPPFLDVTGDRFVAPNDVLVVINRLNAPPSRGGGESGGSGESGGGNTGGGNSSGGGDGEGEGLPTGPVAQPRGDLTSSAVLATSPRTDQMRFEQIPAGRIPAGRGSIAEQLSRIGRARRTAVAALDPLDGSPLDGSPLHGSKFDWSGRRDQWETILDEIAEAVAQTRGLAADTA